MKEANCKLCGKSFICNNGMWFTTCNCAKDKPKELATAQQKWDTESLEKSKEKTYG